MVVAVVVVTVVIVAALFEQTGLLGLKGMNKFPVEISYEGVKYSFAVQRQAPDAFTLSINGQVHVQVFENRCRYSMS